MRQGSILEMNPMLRFPVRDLCFYASFGLYLFFGILSQSLYLHFFEGFRYRMIIALALGLLVLHEVQFLRLHGRASLRTFLTCLLMAACALLALLVAKGMLMLSAAILFVYLYAARTLSYEKTAAFAAVVMALALFFVIFSAWRGWIPDYILEINNRSRHCLGFRYTLLPSALLSQITALTICVRKERLTLQEGVIWALAHYLMYRQTMSRLSFLMAMLVLAAALMMKAGLFRPERRPALTLLMALSFVILAGAAFVLTWTYDPASSWQAALNKVLTGRLYYGRTSLSLYGFGLFPRRIEWVGNGLDANGEALTGIYMYVDCLYIQILQRYGILFTLALLGLLTAAALRVRARGRWYILLVLTYMALTCLVDDLFLYPFFNCIWFILSDVLVGPPMALREPEQGAVSLL